MNTEIIKEINGKFIQQFHIINIILSVNSLNSSNYLSTFYSC